MKNDSKGYYSRPVLKEPVWKPEVALYFFCGGLAGASAGLAFLSRLGGNHVLARRALLTALAGVAVSPALLIVDLGRPERFLNMLRVFKPTSPMNMGTWILTAFGASTTGAVLGDLGLFRPLGRLAEGVAALLGLPLSTYTAVLVADTSIPVWHEARTKLPFVFAGGAAASAGAILAAITPSDSAGPARRLAIFGGLVELGAAELMERELGDFGHPYREGRVARLARAGKTATAAGTGLMAVAGRSRPAAVLAGGLIAGGALAERFAVLWAGRESARSSVGTATVSA